MPASTWTAFVRPASTLKSFSKTAISIDCPATLILADGSSAACGHTFADFSDRKRHEDHRRQHAAHGKERRQDADRRPFWRRQNFDVAHLIREAVGIDLGLRYR